MTASWIFFGYLESKYVNLSEFSGDVSQSKLKKKQKKKKTSFDKELTETDRKSVRQFRAG